MLVPPLYPQDAKALALSGGGQPARQGGRLAKIPDLLD
jgi:hypothetical protein